MDERITARIAPLPAVHYINLKSFYLPFFLSKLGIVAQYGTMQKTIAKQYEDV